MRTSSGVARVRMLTSSELMQTDLPAPVAPAMRMCGVLAMLAQTKPPSMSLPSATSIGRGGGGGAGRAGDEDVRRLGDVGADGAALDVLAERDEHRVVVAGGHAAAQDVAEADVLAVGVRDLDADRALARDRG